MRIPSVLRGLTQLKRNQYGAAAIEFAFALPFLVLLLFGTIEISRLVLVHQKVDKAASQIADYVAQTPLPRTQDATKLQGAYATLMEPFGVSDNSGFVISVIANNEDLNNPQPEIVHQTLSGGVSSRISLDEILDEVLSTDGVDGFLGEDTVIVVETMHQHSNMLGGVLDSFMGTGGGDSVDGSDVYKKAVYRYRFNLEAVEVDAQPASLGDRPLVCGYYSAADDNREPFATASDRNRYSERDWDIYTSPRWGERDDPRGDRTELYPSDIPHPCLCYGKQPGHKNFDRRFKRQISTCVPELINDLNCPQLDRGDCLSTSSCLEDRKDLGDGAVRIKGCCYDTRRSNTQRKCYSCLDENDKIQPPEDPGSDDCLPKEPDPRPDPEPPKDPDPEPEPPKEPDPEPEPPKEPDPEPEPEPEELLGG